MTKIKIHCVEALKKNFDKISMKDLQKMVGWIEPPDKDGTWDVTIADGSIFACKEQKDAQILSSIEEVKALLIEGRN